MPDSIHPSKPATVEPNSFLTLHYRLFGTEGDGLKGADIINTFTGKPATLTLGAGELSPILEDKLLGLTEGDHKTFHIDTSTPAFGFKNPEMVQWVAMPLLAKLCGNQGTTRVSVGSVVNYTIGEVVQFPSPDGQASYAGAVQQVREAIDGFEGAVLFDFNHPLAGQAVGFEVKILGIL